MAYTRYVYSRINWLNKSESLTTPLGKTNLNRMDSAIYNIAENLDVVYNEMSTGKLDKADADKLIVGMPTWNRDTGVLTIHFYDNTTFQIDFNIEKIPISFSMNSAGVITMTTADGTEWTADIGDVIPTYTFVDTDTISITDTKNGDYAHTVKADIKPGSIKEKHLQPNYLTDVKSEVSAAKASAKSASDSADSAEYDAKLAQSYAIGGSGIREGEDTDNSKYNKEQAAASAATAIQKASAASTSATNAFDSASTASSKATEASNSATSAAASATNASASATSAANSKDSASASATNAFTKATQASTSATNAETYAKQAQSYAVGMGGARPNESSDNAKKYYEQAKAISESFSGALRPMGTVTFANLPSLSSAAEGDMYNVSDQFTTNGNFREGSGVIIPAGANVYKTADGKWDVLAGSPVTGVKGNSEISYRKGNVNITAENIGAFSIVEGNELKKSVSDGKSAIASAITSAGVSTASDATFATMSNNINNIIAGDASASNVLSGKTFSSKTAGRNKTGTLTNRPSYTNIGTNYRAVANGLLYADLPEGAYLTKTTSGYVEVNLSLSYLGSVSASQVLSGNTFTSTAGVKVSGTMPNRGAISQQLSAGGSYTIPAGYHNGSGKITVKALSAMTKGNMQQIKIGQKGNTSSYGMTLNNSGANIYYNWTLEESSLGANEFFIIVLHNWNVSDSFIDMVTLHDFDNVFRKGSRGYAEFKLFPKDSDNEFMQMHTLKQFPNSCQIMAYKLTML